MAHELLLRLQSLPEEIKHRLRSHTDTEGKKLAEEYIRTLEVIKRSKDPINAALDIVFRNNGVDAKILEQERIPAGVRMEFDYSSRRGISPEVVAFVQMQYPDRPVDIKTISVFRSPGLVAGNPTYTPGIHIEVGMYDEHQTGLERERKFGFIVKDEENERVVKAPIIDMHYSPWGWTFSTVGTPVVALMRNDHSQVARHTEQVPHAVIVGLAQLIPVIPFAPYNGQELPHNPTRHIEIYPLR